MRSRLVEFWQLLVSESNWGHKLFWNVKGVDFDTVREGITQVDQ